MTNNVSMIPARLRNASKEDPYVAYAVDIYDDTLEKPQSEVNQDMIQETGTLDGKIATEKERAEGVEAGLRESIDELGTIGVDPENAISTSGADFKGETLAKRSKIPTIGAIIDGINDVYDVTANNSGAIFASLSALLSDDNIDTLIPTARRKGGMSIKFIQGTVQSSDNKYVQCRLMAQTFTTDVTKWQGVDDEPTDGSHNFVESGGIAIAIDYIIKNSFVFDEQISPSQQINNTLIKADGTTAVVPGGKIIKYTISNDIKYVSISYSDNLSSEGGWASVWFVDANQQMISCIIPSERPQNVVNSLCKVPQGTVEIWISQYAQNSTNSIKTNTAYQIIIDQLLNSISNLIDKIQDIGQFTIAKNTDKYIDSSGNLINYVVGSCYYSNKIDLYAGTTKLYYTGNYGLRACAVVFFDSADNVVGYKENPSGFIFSQNEEIDVPNNAVSFIISAAGSSGVSIEKPYVFGNEGALYYIYNELLPITNDVEALDDAVFLEEKNVLQPLSTEDGKVLVDDGTIASYSGYKYQIFDVSLYNEVFVSADVKIVVIGSHWAAMQLYDSSNNFVSAISITTIGSKVYENYELDVTNIDKIYVQADNSCSVIYKTGNKINRIELLEEDVEQIEEQISIAPKIVCWGDSLTHGQGLTPYTTYLQDLLGQSALVINGGVQSDETNKIIARQGGISFFITNDIVLPADGSNVAVTLKTFAPVSDGYDYTDGLIYSGSGVESKALINPCYVRGIECTLTKNSSDNKYYLKRKQTAQDGVNIISGTQIITYGAKNVRDCKIAIFYCGENDGAANYAKYLPLIKNGIDFLEYKNFIVISTAISRSDAMENAFYKAFGANYLNLHHLMASYGIEDGIEMGLINVGTPASQWSKIDADCANRDGLLKDSQHWNDTGLKILARFVYQRLIDLGYVS